MAGRLIIPLPVPALDASGNPISGSTLHFYVNGTTTPQTIYNSPALTTAITQPVTANSAGRFVDDSGNITEFWCANDKIYSVKWTREGGATTTFNNIAPSAHATGAGAAQQFALTDLSNVTAGSVTTSLIADDAVTAAKLADNAVLTANILDANVTGPKIAAGVVPVGENILPNTQHEVMTDGANSARYKADSSGVEGSITVSAYTTGANEIVCSVTDTSLLVGTALNPDFVDFSAAADANLKISTSRVYDVVANTSFKVKAPRGSSASASAACTVTPQMRGDMAGATGNANDGWTKTTAAYYFRNTHRGNIKAGHKYSGGFIKTSGAAQYYIRSIPAKETLQYAGRNIVFGMWVKQAVKGGAGTGRLGINQITGGVPSTTYSSSISGSATTSDWTWLTVTVAVGSAIDTLDLFFEANGASGDVYYFCGAHAQIGTYLPEGAYSQPKGEVIVPVVKMSPLTHSTASITFPSSADSAGMYSYNFDLAAETDLAYAPTVDLAYFQAEGRCGTVGRAYAFKDQDSVPHKYGVHPIYAQVVNNIQTAGGLWILAADGTGRPYSPTSGTAWTLVSYEVEVPYLNVSR